MAEIKDYIETVKYLRTRAEYTNRNGNALYLQGMMSPQEALTAFQTFGNINLMQEYVDGLRVVIWKDGRWHENNLEQVLYNLNLKKLIKSQ